MFLLGSLLLSEAGSLGNFLIDGVLCKSVVPYVSGVVKVDGNVKFYFVQITK